MGRIEISKITKKFIEFTVYGKVNKTIIPMTYTKSHKDFKKIIKDISKKHEDDLDECENILCKNPQRTKNVKKCGKHIVDGWKKKEKKEKNYNG